jgi:hypothetical protein
VTTECLETNILLKIWNWKRTDACWLRMLLNVLAKCDTKVENK